VGQAPGGQAPGGQASVGQAPGGHAGQAVDNGDQAVVVVDNVCYEELVGDYEEGYLSGLQCRFTFHVLSMNRKFWIKKKFLHIHNSTNTIPERKFLFYLSFLNNLLHIS
jgi:hypothetical protein